MGMFFDKKKSIRDLISLSLFNPCYQPFITALSQEQGYPYDGILDGVRLNAYFKKGSHMFVALYIGRVIGYVLFRQFYRVVYIQHLMVEAHHRRKGVGQRLLWEVYTNAYRDLPYVYFSAYVHEENRSALEFFKRVGFDTSILIPDYYPPDVWGIERDAIEMRSKRKIYL